MSLFHHDTPEEASFRAEVRAWLEDNVPPEARYRAETHDPALLRSWHRTLFERGWIAPHWPREYGGMGATLEQQLILLEEQARAGAPYLLPTGLSFLGFAIMEFGTERQKRELLPDILSGRTMWSQGYSEPEAGSDLASLRTRADEEGDDFIVNGQKIWSSGATYCDWMFALVRTNPQAKPRQAGISMLLIDLSSPGISIAPIRTITGHDYFALVSFDGVRVPKANLLGPLNGGWKVANHVLTFERLSGASPRNGMIAWEALIRLAAHGGRTTDAALRDRMAQAAIDLIAHIALYRRAVARVKSGKPLGHMSSVMKIAGADSLQALTELLLEAASTDAASADVRVHDGRELDPLGLFLLSRRATIYGGSAEIQRNIIAERVLEFPRSW
jgi:alkylation response protein AidB-like acyl-CoA dehydrogenase